MTKKQRQRWLILAHAFNMDGRAASQTITDKIPHLLAANIELVVLSGVSGLHDARFEHHQLWCALPAGLRFELRHVLQRRWGKGLLYRALLLLASVLMLPFMFFEKLLKPVESSWSWWLSAYLKGRALARQQRFDVIYSTGGAFAAHVAGAALKRATGTPWLAEVHDPLVKPGQNPQATQTSQSTQEREQARVETLICSQADVAIWFTQQALDSARVRHPQLGTRGHVMLPGVDQPFATLPTYERSPKMVVGHFGSLSSQRNLTPFFKALELVHQQAPVTLAQLEFHITGGPLDEVSAAYLSGMQPKVKAVVKHFGRLEFDPQTGLSGRQQILQRMRSSDVLLLLHGEEAMCAEYIPSKMYEYLWMQRPILATVHYNPQMAGILRGLGHTVVNQDDDVAAHLASQLLRLHAQWAAQELPDSGQGSPYTTQSAVGQLLDMVQGLPALRRK